MHTDQRTVGGLPSQALLQSIPLFAGLTESQLDHIAKMAIRRKVPRHSTIVHVGDCIDALYVIVSGGVKVLNRDADGREVILTLLGAGECFGEMGLIDGAPRSVDVVTNENCELLVIAKTDFKRALAENVDLCLNIMKSLVLRLREANRDCNAVVSTGAGTPSSIAAIAVQRPLVARFCSSAHSPSTIVSSSIPMLTIANIVDAAAMLSAVR